MEHISTYDDYTYNLTRKEMEDLWNLSVSRNNYKIGTSARDKRRKKIDDVEMIFIGLMGEYVFSKFSNYPLDRNNYIAGDPSGDFFINGKKIEIKTSITNHLIFDKINFDFEFQSDYSVLAKYFKDDNKIKPSIELCGWIDKIEFIKKRVEKNYGYGSRYAVSRYDLNPINKFMIELGGTNG